MSSVIELGWPHPKRKDYFLKLEAEKNSAPGNIPIDFMGTRRYLPIWRIPVGLPKYRLLNGRTASLQQEWLAQNSGHGPDFFTRDPESLEAQKVQHELLMKLIGEKELLPYFEKPENKQKGDGALILDNNGFVINGNRRLCTWRYLLAKDSGKYGHFANIDVIVLPPADDKAIDELEGELQVERDIRADYTWHSLANMFDARIRLHGLDEKAIAAIYKMKPIEVRSLLEMRDYAAQYLRSRNKENRWSDVKDKYAFEKLVEKRKQISNAGQKALFESAAFVLIDDPSGGRLYEAIPDLHRYIDKVASRLLKEFPVEVAKGDDDGLLGGSPEEAIGFALAKKIDDETSLSEFLCARRLNIVTHEAAA